MPIPGQWTLYRWRAPSPLPTIGTRLSSSLRMPDRFAREARARAPWLAIGNIATLLRWTGLMET